MSQAPPEANRLNLCFPALLALISGALQTLTYAPFDVWPLGLISAGLLFLILLCTPPRRLLWVGWCYGLGVFGSGASWVYVSIHEYGYTPAPLAALLTFLFVAFLAVFCVLQVALFRRFSPLSTVPDKTTPFTCTGTALLVFVATWVFTDWLRSWVLTGFPWLYLGYGHIDSPLANLAPLGGVHLVTLTVVLSGGLLSLYLLPGRKRSALWASTGVLLLVWSTAPLVPLERFTQPTSVQPLKVALVQGNIDQLLKWDPSYRMKSIEIYERLSAPLWSSVDVLLWPETAIPFFQDTAEFIVEDLSRRATDTQTALITGIPFRRPPEQSGEHPILHNSITSLGNGGGIYHKQKLVPFGEYVPLQQILRGIIRFLDLPMSAFRPGPSEQSGLSASGYVAAPFICYEIVYPEFVAETAKRSDFLVTISNDAWFGHSIGPLQHLQIAQMRSLETGRYTLRGTNNGVTAIINARGQLAARAEQFREAVLTGTLVPMRGTTPFMHLGSYPVLALCVLILLFSAHLRRRQNCQTL